MRALTWLVLLGAVLFSAPLRAQLSLSTDVSARKLEVGQSLQFQLIATSTERPSPSDPNLTVPPGFDAFGPSVGSQTQVTMSGGHMTQRVGISATWTLTARRPGTYRIGPASVNAGGRRVSGEVITVEVVPAGTLPRAPTQRRGFDPFGWLDPFGGGLFPQAPQLPGEPEPEQVPEELRVERAPDPTAFVRAVVSPERPVVGEQVSLKIYAYGGRGPFREASPIEPSRADFLAHSVVEHSHGEPFVRVPIDGAWYSAVKVRELALFPLRSGKLAIGSFTMTFEGARYRTQTPIVRASPPLELEVSEPPLAGRPPGYRLGDVGEFALGAEVAPKNVVAGDGVSVVARLEGTGNLPLTLNVPQQKGVEWLDPSLTEDVSAESGVVRGFRAFSYVVKLFEPGMIDLGELTLPYFNPKTRQYGVLRAKLGTVKVEPNPNRAAPSPVASSLGSSGTATALALAPRKSLGSVSPPSPPLGDDPRFWWALFAMPLVVGVTGTAVGLGRRFAERLARERSAPERRLAEALRDAEGAARRGDVAAAASAGERALFLAIEAGTGIKARALVKSELAAALGDAGIAKGTIDAALELFAAFEALRFQGASDAASSEALAARTRATARELAKPRKAKA